VADELKLADMALRVLVSIRRLVDQPCEDPNSDEAVTIQKIRELLGVERDD
jgi:hypothetical protein